MYEQEKARLLQCLQGIIKEIDEIYNVCEQYGGISALEHNTIVQHTTMKSVDILYEMLMKFKSYGITKNMYNSLSQDYIDKIKDTRIISSHNYCNLKFDKIKNFIINDLPNFKNEIQNIIDNFDTFEIYIETEIDEIDKEISKKERQIKIQQAKISELRARRDELKNKLNANKPDVDTPPPPSQGQGRRHKR